MKRKNNEWGDPTGAKKVRQAKVVIRRQMPRALQNVLRVRSFATATDETCFAWLMAYYVQKQEVGQSDIPRKEELDWKWAIFETSSTNDNLSPDQEFQQQQQHLLEKARHWAMHFCQRKDYRSTLSEEIRQYSVWWTHVPSLQAVVNASTQPKHCHLLVRVPRRVWDHHLLAFLDETDLLHGLMPTYRYLFDQTLLDGWHRVGRWTDHLSVLEQLANSNATQEQRFVLRNLTLRHSSAAKKKQFFSSSVMYDPRFHLQTLALDNIFFQTQRYDHRDSLEPMLVWLESPSSSELKYLHGSLNIDPTYSPLEASFWQALHKSVKVRGKTELRLSLTFPIETKEGKMPPKSNEEVVPPELPRSFRPAFWIDFLTNKWTFASYALPEMDRVECRFPLVLEGNCMDRTSLSREPLIYWKDEANKLLATNKIRHLLFYQVHSGKEECVFDSSVN